MTRLERTRRRFKLPPEGPMELRPGDPDYDLWWPAPQPEQAAPIR